MIFVSLRAGTETRPYNQRRQYRVYGDGRDVSQKRESVQIQVFLR